MKTFAPPSKHTYTDLIVLSIVSVITFIIASEFNVFELFYEYSRSHDDWEVDEIAIVLIIMTFSLGVFSWRRWQELKKELLYREWVESQWKVAVDKKAGAEAANQAKSDFLANMSHELRTPLNGILGYAQILQRDKALTKQQQDAVRTILKSGEHLLTLINDVLDLSKVEAGKIELHSHAFQLPQFLHEIVDMMKIRTKSPVSLNYQFGNGLPTTVLGDEVRLRQILVNLLGNAIKFTTQGQVIFQVNCYDEDTLNFKIQDTGVGIPPDHLDLIFEPFRQSNSGKFVEGTGLGLPISQRFVEMMGGKIQVQSSVGQGSTFEFKVKLPKIEDKPPDSSQKREVIGFQGEPCKILVVDDKVPNRMVLVKLLSLLGFDIKEAENGKQCIDTAMQFLPNAIIMDLFMPVMDGLTAMREIRQLPTLKHTVIIGSSASAFDRNRFDCFNVGCDDFLMKPIKVNDLLEKLEHHLKLNWVYEEPQANVTNIIQPILIPPNEVIHALHNLVLDGDIDEIDKQAKHLLTLSKQFEPFANELQRLIDEFDLDQLQAFIETYLK